MVEECPKRTDPVPWWTGLVAFAVVVVLLFIFSTVLHAISALSDPAGVSSWVSSPPGMLVQVLVMTVIFCGTAAAVPAAARCTLREWFTLRPVRPAVTASAAMGAAALGFWVDEAVFLLHRSDPVFFSNAGLDMFNRVFLNASPLMFVLLTAAVTLGPALGEELFFRGLVLRSLSTATPPAAAVGISALLFGVIHFDVLQSPGAAIIGVYLGIVALRGGSLYPAMAAHALNNLVCALFARFSNPEAPGPVETGHPVWVLAASGGMLVLCLVLFFRWTRPNRPVAPPLSAE